MDVSADRDFALDFLYAASVDDAAPEPAGRGLDSLFERGVRLAGTGRRRHQRIEPDAAEEESRFARADPRQMRPRVRAPALAVRHHEGSADDLQPRHAGGQGAAVRRRRPVRGSLEMARVVVEIGEAAAAAVRARRRKRAGWWRPIWPKRWRGRHAVSSGAPDRRAAGAGERAHGQEAADWTARSAAAFRSGIHAGDGAAAGSVRKA